jgi:hypothetical protein
MQIVQSPHDVGQDFSTNRYQTLSVRGEYAATAYVGWFVSWSSALSVRSDL